MAEYTHPLLTQFATHRLIGIVRTDSAESALWTAEQLLQAGIRLLEITLTIPNGISVIEQLSEKYPEAILGAGTVLDANEAIQSLAAGAQFLVSPVLIPAMLQFGKENNVCVLPGCMTPTEMYDAYNLGAPAVKFFPAQPVGGPEFIKAIKAPLPQIPIVPTGGITKENLSAYLTAGALAVGVGSPMMPKALIEARDAQGLQAHAQAFIHMLQ